MAEPAPVPLKDQAAELHFIANALRTTRSTYVRNAAHTWIGFSEDDGKISSKTQYLSRWLEEIRIC
jgi:hypothetical protein